MNLFPPLKVIITLPEFYCPSVTVAKNSIKKLGNPSLVVEVSVIESTITGLYLLETNLSVPFDKLYLKKWGKPAKIPEGSACLSFKEKTLPENISASTEFKWEQYPVSSLSMGPDEIVDSWLGKFQFRQEFLEHNIKGLRTPQIGALHAISASFSIKRAIEPVTIVLPTGTGKTETMLSTLLYQQCHKILVLVPSNSLRDQIGDKFHTLGCLGELGVLSNLIDYPYVTKFKKTINSIGDAEEIARHSNVIVATVSVLTGSETGAIEKLCSMCSHLFVDEAHHISANSWDKIRQLFWGKRVVQFTATPFRSDGKNLGGKIIYNYTMGEAQEDGYFKTIDLHPVEEYFQEHIDDAIAREATAILRKDLADGFDHLMMARVKKKERANNLLHYYRKHAPEMNAIVVHSDYSQIINNDCLALLKTRDSRIVICVDMLGEGYDLPNLKIAAIHDHHKSLAVTLQFIGRFTRSSSQTKIGTAKAIVNIADHGVETALQKLYAQGADWDVVLRRLSENKIEREIQLQQVVDSLKSQGNLHKQLSLWNLRPSYSAMLFKTSCESWFPERFVELLPKCDEHWHSISLEENILVVLIVQSSPVSKWGDFKDINDINHKVLIAHWDKDKNALFVFSNDYKTFKAELLAAKICDESASVMSGKQIFNVLNNIEYPLVTNLGSAQIGAISFTQFFGSNVTQGLSSIEKSQSSLSNIAALGYEGGDKVLWGCSQRKGKIWSPQSGSLSDWRDWVKSAWDKVENGGADDSNITRDFLRPERLEEKHSFRPVSIQWGEGIQRRQIESMSLVYGGNEVPIYLIDLKVSWDAEENILIHFESDNEDFSVYKLMIGSGFDAGFEYQLVSGDELSFKYGRRDPIELSEAMIVDPMHIYYVDGSFSYNCFIVEVKENVGIYKPDDLTSLPWDINIRKESMGKFNDLNTVQGATYNEIKNDFEIIINDDGSGESADLVGLKIVEDEIILSLFHCKYSHGDEPGRRLSDLYEVCGQAQRSIRWKHVGLPYLYKHIKIREQKWLKEGHSRFLKGDMSRLESIKNRSRTAHVSLNVTIVQPGMSAAIVTEEMLKLLGTTELFIKKTTLAELQVWCSA